MVYNLYGQFYGHVLLFYLSNVPHRMGPKCCHMFNASTQVVIEPGRGLDENFTQNKSSKLSKCYFMVFPTRKNCRVQSDEFESGRWPTMLVFETIARSHDVPSPMGTTEFIVEQSHRGFMGNFCHTDVLAQWRVEVRIKKKKQIYDLLPLGIV